MGDTHPDVLAGKPFQVAKLCIAVQTQQIADGKVTVVNTELGSFRATVDGGEVFRVDLQVVFFTMPPSWSR